MVFPPLSTRMLMMAMDLPQTTLTPKNLPRTLLLSMPLFLDARNLSPQLCPQIFEHGENGRVLKSISSLCLPVIVSATSMQNAKDTIRSFVIKDWQWIDNKVKKYDS